MRPAPATSAAPQPLFAGLEVEELQLCSEPDNAASRQAWVPLRIVQLPAACHGTQQQQQAQRRPAVILLHATGVDMSSLVEQQAAFARRGYAAVAMDCRQGWPAAQRRQSKVRVRLSAALWLSLVRVNACSLPARLPWFAGTTVRAVRLGRAHETATNLPSSGVQPGARGDVRLRGMLRSHADASQCLGWHCACIFLRRCLRVAHHAPAPPLAAGRGAAAASGPSYWTMCGICSGCWTSCSSGAGAWLVAGGAAVVSQGCCCAGIVPRNAVRDMLRLAVPPHSRSRSVHRCPHTLLNRPDVDAARIGVTGISLGGMHSWLLAAADERIAAAAPMIGVQHFG